MHLSSELIRGDGHALLGARVELPLVQLGAEGIHKRHGLALVPAVQQVQGGSGEDGAHCVDHALQHDEEHGGGGAHLLALVHLHLVAVSLQTLGLVYERNREKEK